MTGPSGGPAFPAGTVVVDEASGRIGAVLDQFGGLLRLRPVRGGREWEADPARVRSATAAERLSAAVAAANAAARRGRT